jgi:hypothetical protein
MNRRAWFMPSRCSSIAARCTPSNKGVPGVDTIDMNGGTSNLQAGEIFKIRGGKIQEIVAMGTSLPYGTKSPWD